MGYGDAYVYCAIIGKDQVDRINHIRNEINELQKEVDVILEDIRKNPLQDKERGERGLSLMDQQDQKYGEIIAVCSNPIAFDFVADDSWHEAYDKCSQYNFKPVPVKEFLNTVQGKFWGDSMLFATHMNGYCICFPSHYDTDEEFLAEMNVPDKHPYFNPAYTGEQKGGKKMIATPDEVYLLLNILDEAIDSVDMSDEYGSAFKNVLLALSKKIKNNTVVFVSPQRREEIQTLTNTDPFITNPDFLEIH